MNTLSVIHKTAADLRVEPNLLDYEKTHKTFTWEATRAELAGLPAAASTSPGRQ